MFVPVGNLNDAIFTEPASNLLFLNVLNAILQFVEPTSCTGKMPRFLEILSEIRLRIYDYALIEYHAVPMGNRQAVFEVCTRATLLVEEDPAHDIWRHPRSPLDCGSHNTNFGATVNNLLATTAHTLLGVCQQIRYEIRPILIKKTTRIAMFLKVCSRSCLQGFLRRSDPGNLLEISTVVRLADKTTLSDKVTDNEDATSDKDSEDSMKEECKKYWKASWESNRLFTLCDRHVMGWDPGMVTQLEVRIPRVVADRRG